MIGKLASALVLTLALAGCGDSEPERKTYVLVHGAWMGAWAWSDVVKDLEAGGAKVVTVDLPAHGADTTPVANVSLKLYADTVAGAMGEGEPVILVGHSMAGMVISRVAEEHPDRISKLVYLAAYLPKDGQNLFEVAGPDSSSKVGPNLVQNDDGTAGIQRSALGEVFCADCDAASMKAIEEHYRDEPVVPLTEKVTLTAGAFGRVAKVYIRTQHDAAITPELQSQMVAATPVDEVLSLDAAHSPFLSAPAELAAMLRDL